MDSKALDAKIATLQGNAQAWAVRPLGDKIAMARRLMDRAHEAGPRWVEVALDAKKIHPDSPLAGEEWLAGPMALVRNLRLLIDSLEDVERHGAPQLPDSKIRTRAGGQVVVDVFPKETWDRLLFTGFTAEVWMQPEVKAKNLKEHMAVFYRQPHPEGKVALVLGAGNVSSIPPLDTIYKLYAEGQVVILKMNPVNEYLGPIFEEIFAEFIDQGLLQMAYGGAEEGAFLCAHEDVDEIHITGSDRTHDAIVYGTGPEAAERKANDERLIDKRMTSELGNVSPVIIVPGDWSAADLRFHAENLATQLANNGGFNCNAVRVIITHQGWPQRQAFLDHLREVLGQIPQRHPYYPGAHERFDRFVDAHPERVETFGTRDDQRLPWGLIVGVDHADTENIVFTTESWCGMCAECPLPGDSVPDFLRRATAFCNDHVWGTLNAALFVHPDTQRQHEEAVEQAIADLRYGTIVVNHWAALGYGLQVTPWGAYPGHTYDDIQSGIGFVHNTFLFDKPQKTVIRGPFQVKPKPPWFVTNRQTHTIGPRLTDFEYEPGLKNLARIVARAIRG